MLPAGVDLVRRLGGVKGNVDRAALLAIVLAHIRNDDPHKTIARAVGRDAFEKPDSALYKEARFRRLLLCRTPDELLAHMTRLAKFLNGTANVADLAESIIYWGDRVRRRWAFDYYAAASAIPRWSQNEPASAEVESE